MPTIKSLDDLKRIREEALEKRKVKTASGQVQVIVGMGTCGIAAGARDAMKAILETIQNENLEGVIVTQTGCIGLCEKEPIVQVVVGDQPKVTYGKVSPDVARQIMKEHVKNGNVLKEYVIQV
ncbi:NAD(P)-dependent iron-only hydrogenase iron-sulfur protein [Bellilinea caldifistulae]|uniref:NADH dehydrogenase n=1 Tax=Bellilinea caldifistulae TaxID=360411 RepID=A0A0P6XX64_9CHLR|nr:(2Fe-2S) ferredoxin domain-containing protein [Bellilinea caldifistulae]KPL73859.1 NADH dehydrogenase [Bellilinea caldifistulae]GAP11142.1 NAD(P)-dependent iron-only hydrogenase iron-sulfur protein [Bellilinea caldifistulae]